MTEAQTEETVVATLAEDTELATGEVLPAGTEVQVHHFEPAVDAGEPVAETAPDAPQEDAISERQKLREDAVALIVACRKLGVDAIEVMHTTLAELVD